MIDKNTNRRKRLIQASTAIVHMILAQAEGTARTRRSPYGLHSWMHRDTVAVPIETHPVQRFVIHPVTGLSCLSIAARISATAYTFQPLTFRARRYSPSSVNSSS